jgi:hypothetical protein
MLSIKVKAIPIKKIIVVVSMHVSFCRFEPMHDERVLGRCVSCAVPHDDYDNGPERRCPSCRFLLGP